MTLIRAKFLHLDGTEVLQRIIGIGGTGIVIQQGEHALKIPRISRDIELDGVAGRLTPEEGRWDERLDLICSLDDEKSIDRRLGNHSGILRCYNLLSPDHSIEMALMKNGDLQHYLAKMRPGKDRQLTWLNEMAQTMAYIHHQRIIIADIRLQNLLLDDDLSIKFADFGESTLMPLDWDLEGSDDLGFSILTDIGQFGAVMFQIVTGESCKFDIMWNWKEVGDLPSWPPRETLPSTKGVWLGHIIEKCWTHGFRSAEDLTAELRKELLD